MLLNHFIKHFFLFLNNFISHSLIIKSEKVEIIYNIILDFHYRQNQINLLYLNIGSFSLFKAFIV